MTANTVLTEYCHDVHSAGCTICSAVTGEMYFLSHSDIFISAPSKSYTLNATWYTLNATWYTLSTINILAQYIDSIIFFIGDVTINNELANVISPSSGM